MIAALRSRVAHGLHGTPCMRRDHRKQQRNSLRRCGGRMEERIESERPGKNPQRRFLPTNPERPRHRRTLGRPVLYETPERSRKPLIASDAIRTSQRVNEQESGRLQNKLEIAVVVRGKPHLRPRTIGRDALARNRVLKPLGRRTASKGQPSKERQITLQNCSRLRKD